MAHGLRIGGNREEEEGYGHPQSSDPDFPYMTPACLFAPSPSFIFQMSIMLSQALHRPTSKSLPIRVLQYIADVNKFSINKGEGRKRHKTIGNT